VARIGGSALGALPLKKLHVWKVWNTATKGVLGSFGEQMVSEVLSEGLTLQPVPGRRRVTGCCHLEGEMAVWRGEGVQVGMQGRHRRQRLIVCWARCLLVPGLLEEASSVCELAIGMQSVGHSQCWVTTWLAVCGCMCVAGFQEQCEDTDMLFPLRMWCGRVAGWAGRRTSGYKRLPPSSTLELRRHGL